MSYDVHFKAKLEGRNQWVYVGDPFISFTSNTASMIKEVCGSYPSHWDGKKCADMYPVLMQGVVLLRDSPAQYRQFEAPNGWGTVEQTREFLGRVAINRAAYPTAVLVVDC